MLTEKLKQKYYQALEQADKEGNSVAFIDFMLLTISETLEKNTQKNAMKKNTLL